MEEAQQALANISDESRGVAASCIERYYKMPQRNPKYIWKDLVTLSSFLKVMQYNRNLQKYK